MIFNQFLQHLTHTTPKLDRQERRCYAT